MVNKCTFFSKSVLCFLFFSALISNDSFGQIPNGKIAVYFNYPVNTTVSTGVNAIYLNNAFGDTIVAYLNRAKYTIDIAQYDYNQSSGFANIATAINSCYARGVRVRWIYDGSQPNTGLTALNAGVPTLASPTTSAYGIMHNKFVIIDANSTNPGDAIVCTGSEDWGITQFNSDYNNLLFIQDSALAHAYRNEFNMMWGDTGIVANTTLSKFGPYKTDLGQHIFHIGGKTVELYFSPSDHTDSHIQSSINSANTDLYFGVYTFTEVTDANDIVAQHNAGVYTLGIVDQYSSTTGSAYPILTSGLGSLMKTYTNSTLIYHNKMMIVDPSNTCSDPQVLTGSHNWTASADTKNDENTLIIHSDTISNIYYQSFYANYTSLGGTISAIAPCTSTCNVPTGLSASSITTTSALMSWTAVSGATSYTIQYRVVGTSTWSTTTSATNSITLSSLTSATNYECQVETTCSSGSSSFSSSADFTTLATACSVPSGLSATGITSTSATLNWLAISGAVSYNIQYRPAGTITWSTTTSSVNSVTVAGLTSGTNYEFQVQVVCGASSSAYSGSSTFTTPVVTCQLTTGLSASGISTSGATLHWSAVSGAASYTINYRITGTTAWTEITSATTSTSVSGLASGTTYEFQVQTICSATDSSGYTNSSLFTTISSCPIPTGLLATTITTTSALLNWVSIVSAASYSIHYRVSGTTTWTNTTATLNSVTVSGLTPGTTYEYQVQSICSATDSSGYSSSYTFTTVAVPACPVPTGLAATSINSTITLLTWTPVAGAISYSIQYRAATGTVWNRRTASSSSLPITGLTANTYYEFAVQAICSPIDSSGYSTILLSMPTAIANIASADDDNNNVSIYPNPATNETTISYDLNNTENVSVSIYNMMGQEIQSLSYSEIQQPGTHKHSILIPTPGVYFVKLLIGQSTVTRKIVKL